MRPTMKKRSKEGDNVVTMVDVRQGITAMPIFNGEDYGKISTIDNSVAGATDLAFVVVGEFTTDIAFDLDFYFNGGKIGATLSVTATDSTSGVATVTAIAGITDEQLEYMDSITATVTTAITDSTESKVYLAKKVVLG